MEGPKNDKKFIPLSSLSTSATDDPVSSPITLIRVAGVASLIVRSPTPFAFDLSFGVARAPAPAAYLVPT